MCGLFGTIAMADAERKQLSGEVEVDGNFDWGGIKQGGKRGRGTTKSVVAIAVEISQPKGFGRVRMRVCSKHLWRQSATTRARDIGCSWNGGAH